MGKHARKFVTDRCPWAVALHDNLIGRLIGAYALLTRFPTVPQPGLNDPRVHQALQVIQVEYDTIRLEKSSS